VGIDVHVEHLAATPPLTSVTATATVTSIEKNVISFDLEARDPWELIGRGTHRRAVIKTQSFSGRLAKKRPPSATHSSDSLPVLRAIELRKQSRLLWATLNRQSKRNAMNQAMTSELEHLVDWLASHSDQVGVVILSGSGGTFCAGDDVSELRTDDVPAMQELSLRRGSLYRRMTELPQIFIAAIDGMAIGGGFVCACACDLRIATHGTQFGLPEVKLGWPPNYGLLIVQSVLGRAATLRLAVTGDLVSAREAFRLGGVDRVVPKFRLQEEARQLADSLLTRPSDAIAAAKQLLSVRAEGNDEQATDQFLKCLQTPDAKAAINKFTK
jgi:enoyl-CoA hydratase/carnithine racemase